MGGVLRFLAVGFFSVGSATACTVVNPLPPREALKLATVVFRGTVVTAKKLPLHPGMRGRQRFAITLRVSEYWKGNRGGRITLYDLAPGTDCMGAGLQPGNEYLIFASEEGARDYRPDGEFLWYGWTDILAAGTPMLHPMATYGGNVSDGTVRNQMRQLGPGKKPLD